MTHDQVQGWLDAYLAAWKSYDEDDIAALFSEDAEYRYRPSDEPIRGREEIVRAWLAPGEDESGRDEPGTFDGAYEPFAVDGERAVAIGTSTYWTDASRSELRDVFYNCWLLEFDGDGRCRSFTEYWIQARED
jgi:hypothetical protein